MELRSEILVDAPADRVWQVLGERFMHIGEWAAPIASSCPVGAPEPGVGATRSCRTVPFGPIPATVVGERLTDFDRDRMTLAYEAISGLPGFMGDATNRWTVVPTSEGRALVRCEATLTVRGIARVLSCVLRWRLRAGGDLVLQELKHFVETGSCHPRKRSASRPEASAAGAD